MILRFLTEMVVHLPKEETPEESVWMERHQFPLLDIFPLNEYSQKTVGYKILELEEIAEVTISISVLS